VALLLDRCELSVALLLDRRGLSVALLLDRRGLSVALLLDRRELSVALLPVALLSVALPLLGLFDLERERLELELLEELLELLIV
jgi:hypothetical protein